MTTSNQLVWVLAALSFLTTMAVVAHIMAKWKHATPIRMDDYMAIAARVRYEQCPSFRQHLLAVSADPWLENSPGMSSS
jgi:hypothetical protein